jgi:hypothetical protein
MEKWAGKRQRKDNLVFVLDFWAWTWGEVLPNLLVACHHVVCKQIKEGKKREEKRERGAKREQRRPKWYSWVLDEGRGTEGL